MITLRAAAAIFALRHAFSFAMFRYAADAAAMPFRRRHAAATMKRQMPYFDADFRVFHAMPMRFRRHCPPLFDAISALALATLRVIDVTPGRYR